MGKITSVIQFSGRTGNLVGVTGQDGQFYLRNHRRHISNPNTTDQVATRAKVALAGSLSKLIPSDILFGMSGCGKRGRRQRWLKTIIRHMSTVSSDGSVKAVLAPSDLVLSEGGYCAGIQVTNVSITDGAVKMTMALQDDTQALMVAVFADSRSGGFTAVGSKVADSDGEFSLPLPEETFQVANLYLIPITQSSSLAGVNYGDTVEAEGESTSAYASEAIYYNSGRYTWQHSVFIGSYATT